MQTYQARANRRTLAQRILDAIVPSLTVVGEVCIVLAWLALIVAFASMGGE